ncbi:hypothetical protein [Pontibacter chinhatensis]|uniref:Uncharacterized protein n=1 Tax=Pontibacter chinhatensis TaxID=1436961 RepID=A0A1I2WWR4_9BACT|nr:hypothetical protein [Pontibacter chinhatensis]SFH05662.1 hypothetical protein SAMN05421739_105238 [Pontibacter chinhatensis]
MKECCRTGDEQPDTRKKPWLKWLLYLAIALALGFVLFEQITTT